MTPARSTSTTCGTSWWTSGHLRASQITKSHLTKPRLRPGLTSTLKKWLTPKRNLLHSRTEHCEYTVDQTRPFGISRVQLSKNAHIESTKKAPADSSLTASPSCSYLTTSTILSAYSIVIRSQLVDVSKRPCQAAVTPVTPGQIHMRFVPSTVSTLAVSSPGPRILIPTLFPADGTNPWYVGNNTRHPGFRTYLMRSPTAMKSWFEVASTSSFTSTTTKSPCVLL